TLNPFVLDFLIVSRGYALALAFFAWHLDALMRGRTVRASIAAGLALSANLTFLPALAATSVAKLILDRKRIASTTARLFLPGAGLFALICGRPLLRANVSQFNFG